MNNYLV